MNTRSMKKHEEESKKLKKLKKQLFEAFHPPSHIETIEFLHLVREVFTSAILSGVCEGTNDSLIRSRIVEAVARELPRDLD